jgi:arabinofuranosyltransferase
VAAAPIILLLAGAVDRRWMNEDAFINLRVVRNWLEGHGPVFNLDERVEAVTSPLWLMILAPLGWLGLRLEVAAVIGSAVLACGGLALAEWASARSHPRAPAPREGAGFVLPVGAAIFAVLPPAWDYATSGLETGLCLAWLASAYALTSRLGAHHSPDPARASALFGAGFVLGLGPLVRPELALYALPFVLVLALAAATGEAATRRPLWRVIGAPALVLVAAALPPVAYEVFRIGYYAAVLPNTALAKEAFASNFKQGTCYFDNFFGTYRMAWPLAAAGVFAVARLVDDVCLRRWRAVATTVAPVGAGAAHVGYLVAIGGDYMHGRLLVPPVFAMLLPAMAVPLPWPRARVVRAALAVAGAVGLVWSLVCATRFRIGTENVCNIGDERGWYARKAGEANPVRIEDYRGHPFFADGQKLERQIRGDCAGEPPPAGVVGCHRVYVESEDAQIATLPSSSPTGAGVDPRVTAVVTAGAIGIVGYELPDSVHVVDRHGLSDPIVSRFELVTRGRPGHEKKASAAWMLARFAAPSPDDDSGVVAARHALTCGLLGSLVRSASAPLSWRGFLENATNAWAYSKLRIPRDPYEAESRFCGTPRGREFRTGGGGGTAFRWICPANHPLSGLRGWFARDGKAIAQIQPLCGPSSDAEGAEPLAGPRFGEGADESFEVSCTAGLRVVGFHGASDEMVHSVGVSCLDTQTVERTSAGGVDGGRAFRVECPRRGAAVGIVGRAGALVDSLGVACALE